MYIALLISLFTHLVGHVTAELVLILFIAHLIAKSKKLTSDSVGKEYSRIIMLNVVGYSIYNFFAFSILVSAILFNVVIPLFILFPFAQIKLAALLWNFLKLKALALIKHDGSSSVSLSSLPPMKALVEPGRAKIAVNKVYWILS